MIGPSRPTDPPLPIDSAEASALTTDTAIESGDGFLGGNLGGVYRQSLIIIIAGEVRRVRRGIDIGQRIIGRRARRIGNDGRLGQAQRQLGLALALGIARLGHKDGGIRLGSTIAGLAAGLIGFLAVAAMAGLTNRRGASEREASRSAAKSRGKQESDRNVMPRL